MKNTNIVEEIKALKRYNMKSSSGFKHDVYLCEDVDPAIEALQARVRELEGHVKNVKCKYCKSGKACKSTDLEERKILWKTGIVPCKTYLILNNIKALNIRE